MSYFWYAYGWVFVRPRRWLFWKMVAASHLRIWFKKEPWGWYYPNIHWWLLYKTAFEFFSWLNREAWRPFCDWTGGYRRTFPWYARAINRIGATTAGFACHGGECFHCASIEGDQIKLIDSEKTFECTGSGSYGTQEGTDHRFWGITTCPVCGYQDEYEDGSL